MTALALAVALLLSPPQAMPPEVAPLPAPRPLYTHVQAGFFSQYNRQPTLDTASWRMKVGDIPKVYYDGYIALPDCDHLGETVQVQIDGSPRTLTLVHFDCSGHLSATTWMAGNGILGELGYFAARKLDVPVGRGVPGMMAVPWGAGQVEVTAQ